MVTWGETLFFCAKFECIIEHDFEHGFDRNKIQNKIKTKQNKNPNKKKQQRKNNGDSFWKNITWRDKQCWKKNIKMKTPKRPLWIGCESSNLGQIIEDKKKYRNYGTHKVRWILSLFYAEVWKVNGKEYEPQSLAVMQAAIDRYLKEKGYQTSILTSIQFMCHQDLFWKGKIGSWEKKGWEIKLSASLKKRKKHYGVVVNLALRLPTTKKKTYSIYLSIKWISIRTYKLYERSLFIYEIFFSVLMCSAWKWFDLYKRMSFVLWRSKCFE